ncbi:MAG TPA: flagellar hook-associated protein FlgL [Steroidobacteraceae bacterium]|jgi:flagellar hook-associated protein 3 FlgL|nr:flagellar hook-associated protein FlgL [Steroidobacteraceae bacterium]
MINRVSTAGQHSAAISQILKQQTALTRTQQQVASGKRIQTPADDPIGSTRVLAMEQQQSQLEQYGRNADILAGRLGVGEQALSDLGNLLQRARDLTVQAGNGALDDVSLKSIATELKSRAQELVDLANRRDPNGEYLFSGFSTQVQPFSRTGAGVSYSGDQGARLVQISATQKLADSLAGDRTFMAVPEGNGTFTVATGVHAGTGIVDTGQVVDQSAWVEGNYTIEFTAPDAWRVLDGSGNPLLDGGGNPVAGSYVEGDAIAFNGVQVRVSGAPAAGDTFAVAPAGTESLFQTMDDLVAALTAGSATPEARARLGSNLNKTLQQLDQGLTHVVDLRADVGARLSAIDNAEQVREDTKFQLAGSLSDLRDLDYAEAISRMNQQMTGLQAAQAAYTRIGQMSLFDFL